VKTQRDLLKKQADSMPDTKIRALKEEFPWISNYVDGKITLVYISFVEPSLFCYSPEADDYNRERITFLDEGKKMVTATTKRQGRKYFFGPLVDKFEKIDGVVRYGSTIGSVVERLGQESDTIRFIVSYYRLTKAVIIYKLPKNTTLRQIIEKEVELERTKLRNEIGD
jgi:hypothetical protein